MYLKTKFYISLVLFTLCVFLFLFSYTDSVSKIPQRLTRNFFTFSTNDIIEYTYECRNETCAKTSLQSGGKKMSLDSCKMLCSNSPIWPKPSKLEFLAKKEVPIDTTQVIFNLPCENLVGEFVQKAADIFLDNVALLGENKSPGGTKLNINVVLRQCSSPKLEVTTNESYKLLTRFDTSTIFVYISAENFFGARHGLESLLQLIWFDRLEQKVKILSDATVEDAPKFPYRGLMLDTARNYFSLQQIKKVIDGMAMTKLNTFHWHLTDAVSFSVVLPHVKTLAENGAYSPHLVYTPEDVKALREYALLRGVRLVLEIDAPSHANVGWNFFKEVVICGEHDVLNGHLNPDNEDALNLLEGVYQDLLDLSGQDEIFHIGGDEVNLTCWQNTSAARNFDNGSGDMKKFWLWYANEMLKRLKSANGGSLPGNIIMWSSPLTESRYFKEIEGNVVVQSWLGRPKSVLQLGHKVIYSTVGNWYLDCGFGPWRTIVQDGNCDPYTPWLKFYNYRPWKSFGYESQTLGGEACLWTEQVNEHTLETRLWPRTAAFAERVWSDPDVFNIHHVASRFVSFTDRLQNRGMGVEQIWPRWCSDNPGRC